MVDLEKVFALRHTNQEGASASQKGRMLKVFVDSQEDHVRIQLPMGFVKAVLKMAPHWLDKKIQSDSVDMEALIGAIEDNFVGEFVNIQDASGDHVRIVIE